MKKETASLSESHLNESVSRRKLLKILAASGGALAASAALPGKWVKPIVNMGVLPAQAQMLSPPGFRITNFTTEPGSVRYNVTWVDGQGLVMANNTYFAAWLECTNGDARTLQFNKTLEDLSLTVNDPFGDNFSTSETACSPDCGGASRRAIAQLFQGGRSTNQATTGAPATTCGG